MTKLSDNRPFAGNFVTVSLHPKSSTQTMSRKTGLIQKLFVFKACLEKQKEKKREMNFF